MNAIESSKNRDQPYLKKIDNIVFKPVFIMGVQRSGTSILYKILNESNCFNIVTAYHIIRYTELLYNHENNLENKVKGELADFFKNQSQMDRGIDRMQITPDFAEEYGFILAQYGGKSCLNPNTLPVFTELCKKIQYIKSSSKPILLKNPYDFSNFLYINSVFPEAKFIFIHRNPIRTLHSQLRAIRTLLERKSSYMSLLSPQYDKVVDNKILLQYFRFLYSSKTPLRAISASRKLVKITKHFMKNIDFLPDDTYVYTRYEDLCANPEREIKKILEFLYIKPKSTIRYQDFIKPRKTTELKELQRLKNYILKEMAEYLSYCGYTQKDILK